MEEVDNLVRLVEILARQGYLTKEDLMPVIKKGTSRMMGEPEDKIFTSPPYKE